MPSYQSVDVVVQDSSPLHDPVEGVLVRVLSSDGRTIYTQGTTDADGRVGFTLYTQVYSLRFYKFQASFQQPQLIEVLEGAGGDPPDDPNEFVVYGDVFVPPIANDSRLCRASGYFRDITGAPQRYLDLLFIGQFAPVLLEGAGVVSERRAIRTDDEGFACIDLIRCAIYTATVEGLEDSLREVRVPDSPSVNLPDLLFPIVQSVSFDPPGPYSLAVGATLEVTPTVVGSNKVPLTGTACADVVWSTGDPLIATVVSLTSTKLLLRGIGAGTTTLLATRLDKSIIAIPEVPIEGTEVSIVVS